MTAARQRVIEERSELAARLGKLNAFVGTASFFALEDASQRLLEAQLHVMTQYLSLLDQRLLGMS